MPSGRFDTAEQRWAGVGPYYAMFPTRFADSIVMQYSKKGDIVLDPFAGRATSVYSASINGRTGIGIELNPVGWVYGKTKLHPASRESVERRLLEIATTAGRYSRAANDMPEFFHLCFSSNVLTFLLAARDQMKWTRWAADWTLAGLILVYLHGKLNQSLSNQMRQTKSMAPDYAVRWWKEHDLVAPALDPVSFMMKRIVWRYKKGCPPANDSDVYLGDSTQVLDQVCDRLNRQGRKVALVFTSPPYFAITNYHYDQWIRLWILGYLAEPSSTLGKYRERFQSQTEYEELLEKTFRKLCPITDKHSVIYVRTDSRCFTLSTTRNVLQRIFPNRKMTLVNQPLVGTTQTHLFGNHRTRVSEVDLILE